MVLGLTAWAATFGLVVVFFVIFPVLVQGLIAFAIASVVLDLVAAGIALASEHGAPHAFAGYLDALFWTTTQLLTVSSQLPNPERTVTKVLDVVLEAWAIIVVASLAATFSDLLHHRTRHRAMKTPRADVS